VRRRDTHPLDHPGAPLGDEAEADERRTEDPQLDEQAGDEDLPRVTRRQPRGALDDGLEQRPEQGR
jgi:hypothetical protein